MFICRIPVLKIARLADEMESRPLESALPFIVAFARRIAGAILRVTPYFHVARSFEAKPKCRKPCHRRSPPLTAICPRPRAGVRGTPRWRSSS
jgi:hypothetical protein